MGVWGSSLQETKKLFVGYKLLKKQLKKQNKVGLYLIFLQTKIRTVHNQQSHQIAQDKTFVKVWGKVDTVASKHAKQPHPRHPLKSSKHHPSQCPSPHSQPASVCSRINMHNQQCLLHLSYEHWEVKNQDEQADRVDVGMGGFWCIVSLIYIYKFTLGSNTFSLASSWLFVFTQLGSPRFIQKIIFISFWTKGLGPAWSDSLFSDLGVGYYIIIFWRSAILGAPILFHFFKALTPPGYTSRGSNSEGFGLSIVCHRGMDHSEVWCPVMGVMSCGLEIFFLILLLRMFQGWCNVLTVMST